MARKSGLTNTGLTLTIIGAIIAIIFSILSILDFTLGQVPVRPVGPAVDAGSLILNEIVRIILAVILFFFGNQRFKIDNLILLGILIIVFGILVGNLGGLLAVIGGILIIIDGI